MVVNHVTKEQGKCFLQAANPQPETVLRNTKSRHRGAQFETAILAGCDHYRETGNADVRKIPEPMRPIQNLGNGKFVAIYTEKAQADFSGILNGGRGVRFEAKSTSSDRIQQSVVTKRQWEQLELTIKLGGVAFVLCQFPDFLCARISWDVWKSMKERFGRKYITCTEAEQYAVPVAADGAILFLDDYEEA